MYRTSHLRLVLTRRSKRSNRSKYSFKTFKPFKTFKARITWVHVLQIHFWTVWTIWTLWTFWTVVKKDQTGLIFLERFERFERFLRGKRRKMNELWFVTSQALYNFICSSCYVLLHFVVWNNYQNQTLMNICIYDISYSLAGRIAIRSSQKIYLSLWLREKSHKDKLAWKNVRDECQTTSEELKLSSKNLKRRYIKIRWKINERTVRFF